MISCNIIEDLLILYVAKECSEDTKKMVEDHLSTCRSCQNILEALQSPVVPMERVNHELNNKEISFQKGFKKIRHRWIASSILLLLIIPLTGVGFLSRNEIRGEGIAFTSMDEILASRSFLKALEKKDYEKAFEYFDIERVYEEMIETKPLLASDWMDGYKKAEIDGVPYYIRNDLFNDEYQNYLQINDPDIFWSSMMILNSEKSVYAPIPKAYFERNKSMVQSKLKKAIQVVSGDNAVENEGYDYLLIKDSELEYYLPASYRTGTGLAENLLENGALLIPEESYSNIVHLLKIREKESRERKEYYRSIGIEVYSEMLKEDFVENMRNLENEGILLDSFSYSNASLMDKEFGKWQVNMDINLAHDVELTTVRGIIFSLINGKLKVVGGYYTGDDDEVLSRFISSLTLSEDPLQNYR